MHQSTLIWATVYILLKIFICLFVYVRAHACMPQHMCGGWRTFFRRQFSPSTMLVENPAQGGRRGGKLADPSRLPYLPSLCSFSLFLQWWRRNLQSIYAGHVSTADLVSQVYPILV